MNSVTLTREQFELIKSAVSRALDHITATNEDNTLDDDNREVVDEDLEAVRRAHAVIKELEQ